MSVDKHHHWFDGVLAVAGYLVAHFDGPTALQVLTGLVLFTRLALNVREWFKGRK